MNYFTITSPCKIGDSLGYVYQTIDPKEWHLLEEKVTQISFSKNGLRLRGNNALRGISAEELEQNTLIIEDERHILVRKVFVLTDITRPLIQRWLTYMNTHPGVFRFELL